MFTCVYLCLHFITYVYPFPCIYLRLLVYLCLPLFPRVSLCLLVFTYGCQCLLMFTYVYTCLPMFTTVYSFLPTVLVRGKLKNSLLDTRGTLVVGINTRVHLQQHSRVICVWACCSCVYTYTCRARACTRACN